ncbi:hypothetical protein SHKM778_83220 [Streptomyces sp. KM77-8]|uniref:Transposase DDE domain-containing protein n=1 Tax=Streptomyces haneummycinicus TaxID=3074435 RepID=A0AAT9HXG7_9ACTN
MRKRACTWQVPRRAAYPTNQLKGFRGIATRYEKTATSYEAAVTLASFLLWARSV